jgi:hypothetical protein
MPIPADAEGVGDASAVLALFRQLHGQLRDEVMDMDPESLHWVPTRGANSVSTLVVHLIGSEAETLRSVAGQPGERDRDSEFADRRHTSGDLLELLIEADDLIASVEPYIDSARLQASVALPTLPASEVRTGMTWLIGNYGHAREHLGHIQLTKQLHEGERGSGP